MSGKKVLEGSELAAWPCVWSVCVCVCVPVAVLLLSPGQRGCTLRVWQDVRSILLPSCPSICWILSVLSVYFFLSYSHSLCPSGEQKSICPRLSVWYCLADLNFPTKRVRWMLEFWYWCTTQYKSCNMISTSVDGSPAVHEKSGTFYSFFFFMKTKWFLYKNVGSTLQ